VEAVIALWMICGDVVEEAHGKASMPIVVLADARE
jgi:hypothetical protein